MNRILFLVVLTIVYGCSSVSRQKLTKTLRETETQFQDHTGFVLYDIKRKKTVYSFNGEKYFIPASNTKIFTFYTSLSILGDSIPGLYYLERGDSLLFWGTGDPSLLYEPVQSSRVLKFLNNFSGSLYFSNSNFETTPLGPGWAWSDYLYPYSSERSSLPIYGNTYTIKQTSPGFLTVSPSYFKKYFWLGDSLTRANIVREIGSNRTDYSPGQPDEIRTWRIPFKTEPIVLSNLLEDTLKRSVIPVHYPLPKSAFKTLYSIHSDSLYRVMMQESDNFIAEQLLLLCSGVLSDTLKPEIAIRYMKKNHLGDLPDPPVWIDGSGLSRYNLFTPRSIVKLWEKIYMKVNQERLFNLLAVGGQSGTLKNHYNNNPPYIFGKTGTLSNNHSLSGYLITKKGDTLIFSFMSNNFTVPVSEVRKRMEAILKQLHNYY